MCNKCKEDCKNCESKQSKVDKEALAKSVKAKGVIVESNLKVNK